MVQMFKKINSEKKFLEKSNVKLKNFDSFESETSRNPITPMVDVGFVA
jgi:hypothetical protein